MPDFSYDVASADAKPPDSPRPDGHVEDVSQAHISSDIEHILGGLHDAVLFLDRDWRITYCNQEASQISRFTPADLNSRTMWELRPTVIGTELERKYRSAMSERVEQQHTYFYEPFQVWVEIRIRPIQTGIAIVYSDFTARKREEDAPVALTRQLEQVLELTTDAVMSIDREYRFTFLNRRAKELLAPSGNILGRVVWEAFPDAAYEGSPYVENYHRSMERRLPSSFESYYPAPLDMWLSVETRPSDEGILVFFRDVTAERRAQEALRLKQEEAERQRAEIETVYRTAPVGLALFDPVEFRYLRLNDRQAEFFGLAPEQILGQTLTEMAPIAGLREMFEQVARGTPVHDQLLEGELVTRPGEHRYWTVNYYPVLAADGSVQAISAVSLEITRQKQAEAALIQSEKLAAVGRLATSISHEINNPLEAVTNLLYLLAHHEELPKSLRGYTETAQSELARVSQIATQTLRFHRQSARKHRHRLAAGDPVADTGHGISAATRARIFEPFYTTKDLNGTGLGLWISAEIVERHGGRLTLRSSQNPLHCGTVFTLYLPFEPPKE